MREVKGLSLGKASHEALGQEGLYTVGRKAKHIQGCWEAVSWEESQKVKELKGRGEEHDAWRLKGGQRKANSLIVVET